VAAAATANPIHVQGREGTEDLDLDAVLRVGRHRAASAAARAGFGFGEGRGAVAAWALFGSAALCWGAFVLATDPSQPAPAHYALGATFLLGGFAAVMRAVALWRRTAYKLYSIPVLCFTIAAGVLASAGACMAQGAPLRAAYNGAAAVVLVALGTLLLRGDKEGAQRLIYAVLGVCSLVLLGAGVAQLATGGTTGTWVGNLIFSAVCAVLLHGARRWHALVLNRAGAIVAADCKVYDAEWRKLLRREPPGGRVALQALRACVAHASEGLPRSTPGQPTSDLGTLYRSAKLTNAPFQDAVADLCTGLGEHCRCDTPKKMGRAVEKVWRCYGGDVSRLVDLVRSSAVFDSVEDMRACLQRIAGSDAVQLLRIKNRFDLGYDSKLSGGYRDVSMNLALAGAGAPPPGEVAEEDAGAHVCELQLQLRDFYKLKKADGHKRYVEFRNLRAE